MLKPGGKANAAGSENADNIGSESESEGTEMFPAKPPFIVIQELCWQGNFAGRELAEGIHVLRSSGSMGKPKQQACRVAREYFLIPVWAAEL